MRAAARFVAVIGAMLAALLLVVPAASAEPPVNVGTQQIDDQAGVGADTSAARDALDELQSNTRISLHVVLVKSFDGAVPEEWADSAFTKSQLGDYDMLWAIQTSPGRWGYQVGGGFPVSKATLDEMLNGAPRSSLSDGDWSGAIVAAAQGIQDTVANGGTAGTTSGSTSNSGSLAWIWIVVIIAIAVIGFLWYRSYQRKKQSAAAAKKDAGPPPEPYEHLSDRSVNALIQTDNAVRASDSELQLAEGEFGRDATRDFRAAHDDAKTKLTQAFQLRQEIDDEIPEDEQTRRTWMTQILQLCEQAVKGLQAQSDKFEKLRDLKARLPQVLAALPGQIDAQATRLPQAAATLQRLAGAYSAQALVTVDGNTDQANERLQFARTSLDEATKAAGGTPVGTTVATATGAAGDAAGAPAADAGGATASDAGATSSGADTGSAVLAARAAQEAVRQASTLLDAIDRLDHDLAAAATQRATARAHVTDELADAQAALGQGSAGAASAQIQQRLAAVQTTLDATATAEAGRDPVTSLKKLTDADHALDDILAATRSAQQQEKRARASLDSELVTAKSTVSAVEDYIETRRGAVASTARTRLAEARRHLQQAQALADTDANGALAEAEQATSLARQAYAEAHDDVDNWYGGGPGRRSGMGGVGGALLGGILIGSLLDGDHHGGWGGGFGGGGFGGGWGGGGGGFGGGGSFGGGGGGFGGGGSF
jgi:uncharacterized membrane protein YgcG